LLRSAGKALRENVLKSEAFLLTPRAALDVNDAWNYIAEDNIEAADRVLDALYNAMIKLAKNPGIGHWREDLTDKRHRFFLVYSYLIVYREETKPLQIVRVLHAGRDVQSILMPGPEAS
jgi:plasmid stabilization system protein ParE